MNKRFRKRSGANYLLPALLAVLMFANVEAKAQSLPDTIDKVQPSVVSVGALTKQGKRSVGQFFGTGFAVVDGLHVVTNYHVIAASQKFKENSQPTVFTGKGNQVSPRRFTVVSEDKVHDLALLKITGPKLPALAMDTTREVRPGQLYAFTGFPIGAVLGQYPATHRGIVASIPPIMTPQANARQLTPAQIKRSRHPFSVFQLDAIAYPGSSGSPLYDPATGHVVGVINSVFVKKSKEAVLSDPSGITYAIPSRYVVDLLREAGL